MALKARLPTNTPGTNAPMIGKFLFVTAAMFFLPEKPSMAVFRTASSSTNAGLSILLTTTRRARGVEIEE